MKKDSPLAAQPMPSGAPENDNLGLLSAEEKQESSDRQQRLMIAAIGAGLLVAISLGGLALSNLGFRPEEGVGGFLIAAAIMILAFVTGRNLYK
ncbi:MAG TPA: hypothetical protein VHB73_04265, partial [Alphaproteobacteria bacterium]|nr:hypothetical protein [Alphaproteobacteria bacterium]